MKTLPVFAPKRLFSAILGIAVAGMAYAEVPSVAPVDAARLVSEGKALLVDVRESSEWTESGVAAPAFLLAKSDFDGARKDWGPFLESVGDKQVILYCRSGRRSDAVAAALAKEGINVANAGSFAAWKSAGLPIRTVGEPPASK